MLLNEHDAFAAEWLRNLISAGHLPAGVVDTRSICELKGSDCHDTTHFFAGIGGWPLALRLAGWPDDLPVWTGSCPCQPFSSAGKRKGTADARHLWPEMFRLVSERRPPVVFGEQVASKDGLRWLDGVFADLEGAGYACGAADLCAAGVGAPHIRQRLFWVAVANGPEFQRIASAGEQSFHERGQGAGGLGDASDKGLSLRVGDRGIQREEGLAHTRQAAELRGPWSDFLVNPCSDGEARRTSAEPGDEPWLMGFPKAWDEASPNWGGWVKLRDAIVSGVYEDTETR